MKKKAELEEDELEIHKAVAQAWHGRSGSGNANPTKEFDAHRSKYKNKPTRFKLEAMNKSSNKEVAGGSRWDFGQSLWDSYEIVTLSKRLEAGLVLDQQMNGAASKRRKESKNSLRNLLNKMSSKRFDDSDIPHEDDSQF